MSLNIDIEQAGTTVAAVRLYISNLLKNQNQFSQSEISELETIMKLRSAKQMKTRLQTLFMSFDNEDEIDVDIDDEPEEEPVSMIQEILSRKSLAEFIIGRTIPLYGYSKSDYMRKDGTYKYPPRKDEPVTGQAVRLNKCFNLAVLDIDIDKHAPEEDRERARKYFLDKLAPEDVIEKTTSGGLHVYCLLDGFPIYNKYGDLCNKDSINTVVKGVNVEVELLASHNSEKRQNVTIYGTEAKNKLGGISKYVFVRNNENTAIKRSMKDVLESLNLTYAPPKRVEKKFVDINCGKSSFHLSDKVVKALVDGIQDPLVIHNTTHPGNGMKEEASLMLVFKALNAIKIGELREKAYNLAEDCCTEEAKGHFDEKCDEFEYERFNSLYMLYLMIKTHNPKYYEEIVKPLMRQENLDNFSSEANIDLKNSFSLMDIKIKCEKNEYKSLASLAIDLTKVFCQIGERLEYAQKIKHKRIERSFYMETIDRTDFEKTLRDLEITVEVKKDEDDENSKTIKVKKTGWNVYLAYSSHFIVSPSSKLLDWFIGYKYDCDKIPLEVAQQHPGLIRMKKHCLKILFSGDERAYNFWWNAEKWKYRNHNKKCFNNLFKCKAKRTGKTNIAKIFREAYDGYAISPSDTSLQETLDPKHIGRLRAILYIFAEELPPQSRKFQDLMKSFSDGQDQQDGRTMYHESEAFELVADVWATSNHADAGYTDDEKDSRWLIGGVSAKKSYNLQYFKKLMKDIQPAGPHTSYRQDFMEALATVLMYEPIDNDFVINNVPQTEAKSKQVKETLENKFTMFIEHYEENLVAGLNTREWDAAIGQFIKDMHLKCTTPNFKSNFKKQEYDCTYNFKQDGHSTGGIRMKQETIDKILGRVKEENNDEVESDVSEQEE